MNHEENIGMILLGAYNAGRQDALSDLEKQIIGLLENVHNVTKRETLEYVLGLINELK